MYICKTADYALARGFLVILTMKRLFYIFSFLAFSVFSSAQETPGLDDLRELIRNSYMEVKWVDSRYFTYSPVEGGSRVYYLVDTRTWKRIRMFDNVEFASKLNEISQGGAEPDNIRIWKMDFDPEDIYSFGFTFKKEYFHYNIRKKTLVKADPPQKRQNRDTGRDWRKSYTSDSLFYVSSRGHDAWLFRSYADSVRLSDDGEQWYSYAMDGKSEKNPDKKGSVIGRWVGKSHKRLMVREDWRSVGTLTLVNSLAEPRPTVETYKFPMPADTGVVRYEVMLADADSGKMYRIDVDRFKDQIIKLPLLKHFRVPTGMHIF